MTAVLAFRFTAWGSPPALTEVADPSPADGEVLVRVLAAGACHSDLHVVDAAPGAFGFTPPFTLGHEIAGEVVPTGDRVAVYGPWGCGECVRCRSGMDNYCDRRGALGWAGVGLGRDGGMASHVLVPERYLVPIGDLPATQAAPLTDAGLTPYHAIAPLRDRLGPGSAVAVIGIGGLGHLAVQILRAVTPTRVFAVDVREAALELAVGAEFTTLVRPDTSSVLRTANGGTGFDAVLDFVGNESSLALGSAILRAAGELVIVGSGGGRLGKGGLPAGARVSLPFWGTRAELGEVVALAREGWLRVAVEEFPLPAAAEAFTRLRAGGVRGRAVLVPE